MKTYARHKIKVCFDNFDTIFTEINGTPRMIADYYIGKMFNLGQGENDLMAKAVSVSFYDGETYLQHKGK